MEMLRAHDGVLSQRVHPRATIQTLLARRSIVRVLPGVFVDVEKLTDRRTRYAAALIARPAAVLWADSALAVFTCDQTPFVNGEVIHLAQASASEVPRGLLIHRRRIDEVGLHSGLRCPSPAVVAVHRAAWDGGQAAERFLRDRLVCPADLIAALDFFENCRDQKARRKAVISYADNPWSGGERELHLVLREGRITGWQANALVRVFGFTYYPDLLFERSRLVVEFDGYAVHGTPEAFEADRIRQNRLVLAGYRVLRYTWKRLQEDREGLLAEIRAALADVLHLR